ncbi:dihydropteroate synthase, partial [bacterium]|nr:dihydropteroate synthase [candidate division CSSED10-310 bacterium]
ATHLPLIAQANAGLPRLEGTRTIFDMAPDVYVAAAAQFLDLGVAIIGGCCGTSPAHIELLRRMVGDRKPPNRRRLDGVLLGSRVQEHRIGPDLPFTVIGERINPTGRKTLTRAIRQGDMQPLLEDARAQAEAGAHVLDVNVSVPGIDEPAFMKRAIMAVQNVTGTPLSLDSPDPRSLEAGCTVYAGRPLINSVSGEKARMEAVLPVAARYGAALICLTIDDRGLPEDTAGRLRILRRILAEAQALGLRPQDLLVDCLTLTAGSHQDQGMHTLRAVRQVREELGLTTVLGISNVSFGMPQRPLLTSAYLAMNIGAGLDAAIVNPLQDSIMELALAAEVLSGRDHGAARYIARCRGREAAPATPRVEAPVMDTRTRLRQAILQGDRDGISALALAAAVEHPPYEIIQDMLMPVMNEVGDRYEKGEFFLPQLILSGETMLAAFEALKDKLRSDGGDTAGRGAIVFATVKGDIHDIGKNIVSIVLRNHGFTVVDLGKDVPLETILDAVREHQPRIVALSALMTTTMPSMSAVVKAVNGTFPEIRTMVGGAVVTQRFADEIGADGYARDAVSAGRLALRLVDAG